MSSVRGRWKNDCIREMLTVSRPKKKNFCLDQSNRNQRWNKCSQHTNQSCLYIMYTEIQIAPLHAINDLYKRYRINLNKNGRTIAVKLDYSQTDRL